MVYCFYCDKEIDVPDERLTYVCSDCNYAGSTRHVLVNRLSLPPVAPGPRDRTEPGYVPDIKPVGKARRKEIR